MWFGLSSCVTKSEWKFYIDLIMVERGVGGKLGSRQRTEQFLLEIRPEGRRG